MNVTCYFNVRSFNKCAVFVCVCVRVCARARTGKSATESFLQIGIALLVPVNVATLSPTRSLARTVASS